MPATDDELQFHLFIPLPYRVFFLFGLGILGWATNLHALDVLGVDAVAAMDLRTDNPARQVMPVHHSSTFKSSRIVALYRSAYRIAVSFATFSLISWSLFRLATQGDPSRVDAYKYIPVITAITFLLILVCPYNVMQKTEREKFALAIRRCVFPAPSGPIYFSDVILADIGTSFAKVFGEVWLSLWMLKPGNSMLASPAEDGWLRWVFPTVMSIPFFLRFRQCLNEYNLPDNDSQRPLFNALKYATSFPVIYLSAAQRIVVTELLKEKGKKIMGEGWHGEHPLFRLWLLAAIINSLYSFWWDVTNDWGLDLLKFGPPKNPERQPPKPLLLPRLHSSTPLIERQSLESLSEEDRQPLPVGPVPKNRHRQSCYGLRTVLLYPRAIYPVLIFLNLLLRMTWSVKLSTHIHSSRDGSVAFFWLQIMELVRRWLWVFVRVEWETIKKARDRVLTSHLDDRSSDEREFEMIPNSPDR